MKIPDLLQTVKLRGYFLSGKRSIDCGFVLVLIIYSVLGIFLLKYYQYQISPDGVSYITIAEKYARGDITNAVNGMWGPLISWLLVPFLFLGISPLIGAKIITLLSGIIILAGLRSLSYKFKICKSVRVTLYFCFIPIILSFALSSITPDLLFTCIFVVYLCKIFNSNYPDKKSNGITCGLLGGVAYLTKHFGFPFFTAHFLLMNIFYFLKNPEKRKRKKVARNLVVGFSSFFIISGIWATLLSHKYDEITIGTVSRIGFASLSREWESQTVHLQKILEPPNETALSAWEDYSFIEMETWHPFQSFENFKRYLTVVLKNLYDLMDLFKSLSPILLVIISVYVLLLIQPLKKLILKDEIIYPFGTLILYSLGFILTKIIFRYLWLDYFLLMLMGGYLLTILFTQKFFSRTRKVISLAIVFIFFTAFSFNNLNLNFNSGKNIYLLSKRLENQFRVSGSMASNKNWIQMTELSYYLNNKYYGEVGENACIEELESELLKHNIDYFFVWHESKIGNYFSSHHKDLTRGKIPGLQIFYLKNTK